MTQNPETDVAAFLAGAGLGLTLGTNLFKGGVLAQGLGVPAEAVFVEAQGGGERPEPYLGAGDMWPTEVEITVRGPAGNRATAHATARTLLETLHRATISGYVMVLAEEGEPEHMEADEAQCHEYTFSIILQWAVA
jgi:hypothetical protein